MGVHFETPARHVVTSAEHSFLTDPTQEPAIPGSVSGQAWTNFAVTLYPAPDGMPEPADVNQHAIGNCDGDAVLAHMAYMNPNFVMRLITDNGDGTFAVDMFDPMGNPITVGVDSQFFADSSGNIGQVSCKMGVACWSTVLEKAYIKYNQVYGVVSDIGGIGSEFTTPMFTGAGDSFAFNAGSLSAADITRAVKAFLAAGKLVTCGFNMDAVTLPSGGTPAGGQTVTLHGYSGLVPPDGMMMAARNPWGEDPTASGMDTSTDGVMTIPSDPTWAGMMDLRIIEPGAACGPGQTTPYVPQELGSPNFVSTITEAHVLRFRQPRPTR